ncbi:hypothetical protein JCM10207_005843 [Rhodosporidiobolus poonsookiae]
MPSAKPPPPPQPGQTQLRFTSFAPVGFLNGKNVSSSFARHDNQSWFARRPSEQDAELLREGKRRRMMASEDEIERVVEQQGEGGRPRVATLVKAPEGGVRMGNGLGGSADAPTPSATSDPLARTLILHPGSRFLRIGLASSPAPVTVPNVIARKDRSFKGKGKAPAAGETGKEEEGKTGELSGVAAPAVDPAKVAQAAREGGAQAASQAAGNGAVPPLGGLPPLPFSSALPAAASAANGSARAPAPAAPPAAGEDVSMRSSPLSSPRPSAQDDPSPSSSPAPDPSTSEDPLSLKIASLKGDLRARMRVFKLRGQGNGNSQAAAFNASVAEEGEEMGEGFESGSWEWTTGEEEVYVGNKAVRLPDPSSSGYTLRRPYDRGDFCTVGYSSAQELLGDVEAILVGALKDELGIQREELKSYSLILLLPDLYPPHYVREMADLALRTLGFAQLALMQESVCATFGAGVGSACVVNIGARVSTVCCVEEGMVLPETRMILDFGGDDITSFLLTLLRRINFPYKDADLARYHDWSVIEELKERLVVLSEGDIGLNLYDFYVRRPGLPTRKYSMRVYDDCILAPYALFAPRVIDFEQKRIEGPSLWSKDVDDNVEIGAGGITNAMRNSTKHLLAPPSGLPSTSTSTSLVPPVSVPGGVSESFAGSPAPPSLAGTPQLDDPASAAFGTLPLPALPGSSGTTPVPAPAAPGVSPSPAPPAAPVPAPSTQAAASASSIDVRYEASKLPLDVAVVESILAAGPAEERLKKVAANLLIVGGTGGIHNVGFAVESRVAPALAARAPVLAPTPSAPTPVAYVPCPRDVEPEHLAWKGIASLARLEGVANELWVRREEWERVGMRAVRERGFYWA